MRHDMWQGIESGSMITRMFFWQEKKVYNLVLEVQFWTIKMKIIS